MYEISKDTYLGEHLRTSASKNNINRVQTKVLKKEMLSVAKAATGGVL